MKDEWTALEEVLAGLPRSTPDAARAVRVKSRCHRKLARPPLQRRLESVVVGGFCAVYFLGVALIAWHAHGLL